jgi:hypothetical protein
MTPGVSASKSYSFYWHVIHTRKSIDLVKILKLKTKDEIYKKAREERGQLLIETIAFAANGDDVPG